MPERLLGLQAPSPSPGEDMTWPLPEIDERLLLIFLKVSSYLAIAFALGLLVAGVHYLTATKQSRKADRSFLATLVLLSVLICLVTLVIGDNIARAFSLAGALAIIRFRTVVEDTRDTAFVIFSVASGMAVGAGFPLAPVACAPLVLLGGWMFRSSKGDNKKTTGGMIHVRLTAGRMPGPEVEALIATHAGAARLVEMGTARGGSALDLRYAIRMPVPERVFALVTALSALEVVQSVEVKES